MRGCMFSRWGKSLNNLTSEYIMMCCGCGWKWMMVRTEKSETAISPEVVIYAWMLLGFLYL